MAIRPILPALDPAGVSAAIGSGYPEPFRSRVAARRKQRLGDALGLKNFGVNLTTIPAGSVSALRHWHTHEDEFVFVLSGELVLVTGSGEQVLTAGMCAGFPAGKADGHQLVNRSGRDAVYLEVGDRDPADVVTYPDDDLAAIPSPQGRRFTHKGGTPY
ncbi:MAG TPA: cupin domain-containing protein [Burkholderiales bacterium]|nr:cupin domain-containing protein [Burkholderiales bacterium]